MKPTSAVKDQAARFARLFLVAFLAALAPAVIALKGPVDAKVVEALVAGAAVGAAETAWRQLRPTVPAGSLVDVVEAALCQAKARAVQAQSDLDRIQSAVAPPVIAATLTPMQGDPAVGEQVGPPGGVLPVASVAAPIQL